MTLQALGRFESVLQANEPLQVLLAFCRASQIPVYLVGGAIRDWIVKGKLSQDLDIVVPMDQARYVAQTIATQLDAKCICLDAYHEIYRVILLPSQDMLDIAGCEGETIEADLLRRDLTVNAIGYDFQAGEILDPAGGQHDLERRFIRMVSEKNLLDDPLRLLRVFRIAADLEFDNIDPKTLAAVNLHAEKLFRAASERIHYELMKLLSAPGCYAYIRQMADIGLLEHLFPELSASRPIPGNQYHHLGLFDHTLELLNQAEIHYPDLPEEVQQLLLSPFNPFIKRIALVRLACLFHDIGKPATMKTDTTAGKVMFYGHDAVSEELTHGIALRMKWGKELARQVGHLVRWHLYPGDMLKPEVTSKAHRKFFKRIGVLLPEMLLLAIADRYSAKGPAVTSDDLSRQKAGLLSLWDAYKTVVTSDEFVAKLLSGREIMELLGIESGPRVGEILRELSEAQLNGELSTADDAKAWLSRNRL